MRYCAVHIHCFSTAEMRWATPSQNQKNYDANIRMAANLLRQYKEPRDSSGCGQRNASRLNQWQVSTNQAGLLLVTFMTVKDPGSEVGRV